MQALVAVKVLVGRGKTVTKTVVIVEGQAGVELLVTCKVSVFVPALFQLKEKGPVPLGEPWAHTSQFQEKVAPWEKVPV